MAAAPQAFQVVADGILVFDALGSGGSGLVAGSGDPFDRFIIYNSPLENFFVFNVNGSADTPPSTTGSGDPFDRFTIYNSQFDNFFVFNVNGSADAVVPQPTVQVGLSGGSGRRYPIGNLDLKTWRKKGKRLKARVELVQKQIQVERDRLVLSTSEVRIEALKKRIAELQRVLLALLAQLDMSNKAYQEAVEEDEAMMAYLAYRRMH